MAFEYGPVHERAGSIRMHETLPFFSGRSGIEGVYNQSSTTTHPVYYLISELFPSSPNPFRSRTYSRFDPDSGLARLRLLNVSHVVAVSDRLVSVLDARAGVVREARIPPYTVYRVADPGTGYVEPLAYAPVRSPREGWRDQSFRWFSRKPPNRAVLVFTDDPRFDVVATDPWAPPPERPLPAGVEVTETFEAESIRITTSRPGHPLLVKVSYHPRWRAEGADGPYLASPGFMLIVPRQRDVRLVYAARTGSDWLGLGLAAAALAAAPGPTPARLGAGSARRRGAPGRGALRALPIVIVVALAALRLEPTFRAALTEPSRGRVPCAHGRDPRRARLPGLRARAVGGRGRVRSARGRAASPRPTRGGPACSASAARRFSGPVTPEKRSSRSRSSSRAGRDRTGRRPCTRAPSPARRRETRRALPPGAGSSARSTPRRRGRSVSRQRPARPPARDRAHGRRPPWCYTRLALAGRRDGAGPSPSLPRIRRGKRHAEGCVHAGPRRLLSPPAVRAEGVAIDHQTVGCVVAGKYPRLNACFAPRSGLARARLYFRVADAPPDWYYVEMASDAPCHAGILPRPKKELIGRRIQYYVDAFDRSFSESRTPEAEALVVASASECDSKLPVAPLLNSATRGRLPRPAGRLRRRCRRPGRRGRRGARGGRRRGRGGRGGGRGGRRLGEWIDTHDDPAARRGR